MPTTAWKYAGTGSAYHTSGILDWSNPGNITSSNDVYATTTISEAAIERARNFGFTSSDIPSGATIVGIEIGVERSTNNSTGVGDFVAQLCIHSADNSSDRIGSNQATGGGLPTTDTEIIYGGASNLLGASPTQAQITASSFGFDYAVSFVGSRTVSVDAIRMRVTYSAATNYTLTAAAGSASLTGQLAGLAVGRVLSAGAGALALAGQPAGLNAALTLAAGAGSLALTGYAANLTAFAANTLFAGAGALTLTGQPANLTAGRVMTADAGALLLGGQPAGLSIGQTLVAAPGALSLVGYAASLNIGLAYSLAAGSGSLSLSGQPAALTVGRQIAGAAGSLDLTGYPASFVLGFAYRLTALPGTLSLSGFPAQLAVREYGWRSQPRQSASWIAQSIAGTWIASPPPGAPGT